MTELDWLNKVHCGDALTLLKQMPSEFVDLIITSPPYYGQRNYFIEGQIGLEPTFDEYLAKMLSVTAELKRILKKTGQFWLNIGDTYGGSRCDVSLAPQKGKSSLLPNDISYLPGRKRMCGDKYDKCLLMIPERLAIAMLDTQGWKLRNKIIWAKQVYIKKDGYTIGATLPTSAHDRFKESFEFFYFFVKHHRYYSNLDAVRIPVAKTTIQRAYFPFNAEKTDIQGAVKSGGGAAWYKKLRDYQQSSPKLLKELSNQDNNTISDDKEREYQIHLEKPSPLMGSNLPTVWQISFEYHAFREEYDLGIEHFATFPQALCEIPILFGCPANGIVLDPFCGSGTALLVAKRLGRQFIGIDINPDFVKLAEARLKDVQLKKSLF